MLQGKAQDQHAARPLSSSKVGCAPLPAAGLAALASLLGKVSVTELLRICPVTAAAAMQRLADGRPELLQQVLARLTPRSEQQGLQHGNAGCCCSDQGKGNCIE